MAALMFENRYILTRALHKELYRKMYAMKGRNIRIVSALLMVLTLVLSLVSAAVFKNRVAAGIFLFTAVYFGLMIPYAYIFREWLDYRSLQRDHGAAIVQIVSFNSDRIHVKVNKTDFNVKYTTIDGKFETDELTVFELRAAGMPDQTLAIWKKGFTDKAEDTLTRFGEFIDKKSGKSIFTGE